MHMQIVSECHKYSVSLNHCVHGIVKVNSIMLTNIGVTLTLGLLNTGKRSQKTKLPGQRFDHGPGHVHAVASVTHFLGSWNFLTAV